MPVERFPPLESADEDGLLAIGGDLSVETLVLAYSSGIFPWPVDDEALLWFSPPQRAVLFLDEFKMPKSLAKERRKQLFQFAFNKNFRSVVERCSSSPNRRDKKGKPQKGTWITRDMIDAYEELHRAGFAHSCEAYLKDVLVGGLYGVSINGMFAGESMFYVEPNASKLCIAELVEHLRRQGVPWIDCQVMTPLFEMLGAREIPREEFIALLKKSLQRQVKLFPR